MLSKVFELILLSKLNSYFCTTDYQFGFKSNHSTDLCTTNLAAVVWMCVSVQNLTNFCPHALISNPNVPKMLFA